MNKVSLIEINEEIPTQVVGDGTVITPEDFIAYNGYLYGIDIYEPGMTKEFATTKVYLWDKYFYPYRGEWSDANSYIKNKPGLYIDENKNVVKVDPSTDEEREEFSYGGKIHHADYKHIIDVINSGQVVISNDFESGKASVTPIGPNDDILKRGIKMAIRDKGIILENWSSRFPDKNSLFNFKQVLNSDDKRVSILLFDRAASALNLKYTIIIEDASPNQSIGRPLPNKIIVHSDDTYDI